MSESFQIPVNDPDYLHAIYGGSKTTQLAGGTRFDLSFKLDFSKVQAVYCKRLNNQIIRLESAIQADSKVSGNIYITERLSSVHEPGLPCSDSTLRRKASENKLRVQAIPLELLETLNSRGLPLLLPEHGIALGLDVEVVRAANLRASVSTEVSQRLKRTASHHVYSRGLLVVEDDGKKGTSTYWFKILGQTFHVKSVKLSESGLDKTGVYTSGRSGDSWVYEGEVKDCLYSHNSDLKRDWYLFSNEEDAENQSTILATVKTQQLQAERSKLKQVSEVDEQSHRNALESGQRKAELDQLSNTLDREKATLTQATLKSKSDYEERSHQRKDRTESIVSWGKIAAGITATAGTTILLAKKLTSSGLIANAVNLTAAASSAPLALTLAAGGIIAGVCYCAYRAIRWVFGSFWS